MKLRTKLNTFIISITLIISIILAVFSFIQAKQNINGLIAEKLASESRSDTHYIEFFFDTLSAEMELLTSRTILKSVLLEYEATGDEQLLGQIRESLTQAITALGRLDALSLTTVDGSLILSTSNDRRMHPVTVPHDAMAEEEFPPSFHLIDDRYYVQVFEPLIEQGEVIALLYAYIDLSELYAVLLDYSDLKLTTADTVFVKFQENGDALFLTPVRYDPDSALSRTLRSDQADVSVMQAKAYPEGRFIEAVDYRGVPVLSYVRYLALYDMGLSVELDTAEIYDMVRDQILLQAIIILALLVAMVILSTVLTRKLLQPVQHIGESIHQLTNGNFIEVEKVPDDELGELSTRFNQMLRIRKTLGEEIEQERNRYRTLLNLSTEAIFILDPEDGRLLEYSALTQENLGYSDEEMKSLTVLDWDKDLQGLKDYQKITEGIGTGQHTLERVHTRKDGSTYIAEILLVRISWDGHDYIFSSVRDITEKRARYEKLNRLNTLLNQASEIGKVGFWEYDMVSRKFTPSDGLFPIFGLEQGQENIGKRLLLSCYPEEERKRFLAEQKAVSREQRESMIVSRIITPAGEQKTIEQRVQPVFDGDGRILRFIGSVRDITELKEKEEALEESQFRLRIAIEGSMEGLWDWNLESDEVFFSPQWKAMLGFTDDEITGSLEEWERRLNPEDREQVYQDLQDHFDGKTTVYSNEHRLLCKDGSYKWILDRGLVVRRDDEGKPLRMIGIHLDISEQKAAALLIEQQKQEFEMVLQTSLDGIALLDPDLKFIFVNRRYAALFGMEEQELLSRHIYDLVAPYDAPAVRDALSGVLVTGTLENYERFFLSKGGLEIRINSSIALMPGKQQLLVTAADTTERYHAMEHIKEQAVTDDLTGLANRKAYHEWLASMIAQFHRYDIPFSLLMLDLDHFKVVNDTYGHQTGDEVLVRFSRIMTAIVRKTDHLFRVGGEEFVVLLNYTTLDQAVIFAERVRAIIEERLIIGDGSSVTVSIGAAEIREDDDQESILRRADSRLYRAKQAGRNRVMAVGS